MISLRAHTVFDTSMVQKFKSLSLIGLHHAGVRLRSNGHPQAPRLASIGGVRLLTGIARA
jgi:hypothetical protein